MDTVQTAVEYIRHNRKPYWWVKSGSRKVGECTSTDNVEDSIHQFLTCVNFLPPGSYQLECSDKENNRSGSLNFPFTKAQSSGQSATPMPPAQPSTNVYGIPDAVYQKIQEETRQKLLVEQMHGQFMDFMQEWPEYKKKIDKCVELLKDEDDDGIPDLFESAKKVGDTIGAVSEVKKLVSNGKLFGK
ncbi:hypothetical protein [Spirosoma pomorum]